MQLQMIQNMLTIIIFFPLEQHRNLQHLLFFLTKMERYYILSQMNNYVFFRKSQTFDLNDLHIALEDLTTAVKCLIELYCRTFHTDFRFESASVVKGD